MISEDMRTVVEAATMAPSLHNSQPWRFRVDGDVLDVFADRARELRVIDPAARELHVSCGAAIFFARTAVRALDRACLIELLPDPADPDHLARITAGGADPVTVDEQALAEAIPLRYTDRGVFDERPVPAALVEQLRAAASAEGGWLRVLDTADDEIAAAVLLARANDIELDHPDYEAELAAWSRSTPAADDGIPRQAVPATPVAERGSVFRLRDFDVDGTLTAAHSRSGVPPTPERPLVVVLGTPGDDPASWLEAGQALGRLLLRAAADGVTASPMTQVVEVPATRTLLARSLGLLGHPQIVLRLGYGHGRPRTHRRPLADVIAAGRTKVPQTGDLRP
ncbi:MAG TPA: hypothetical protein VNG13_01125 [Mycobacteriales bacterium]|nr:hypothetical protein [Mycobacteriales bacterium]